MTIELQDAAIELQENMAGLHDIKLNAARPGINCFDNVVSLSDCTTIPPTTFTRMRHQLANRAWASELRRLD